jgi:hypothetical protein
MRELLSCVDAALWQILARRQSLLDKVHGAFPEFIPITLEQKCC